MTDLSNLSGVSEQVNSLSALFAPKHTTAPDVIQNSSFRILDAAIPGRITQELGGVELGKSVHSR